MKSPLTASPAQARQTKQQFANPEDYLSFELGKAVQELPPLYTRLLAGTITLLVGTAIGWAYYSEVEEVATATGQLIPSAEVRPIRSLSEGMIKDVKIKEGDRVQPQQILVEKDPQLKQGEIDRLEKSQKLIQEDLVRLEAERTGNNNGGTPLQDQLLNSRLREYNDKRAIAIAEANKQIAVMNEAKVKFVRLQENLENAKLNLNNAQTTLENTQNILPKSQENLQLAQQREESLRGLVETGSVPRLDYLDAKERVVRYQSELMRIQEEINRANDKVTESKDRVSSLQKDIIAQGQQIKQAEQAYNGAVNTANRLVAERQSEILTQMAKRKEELTYIDGQIKQAKTQRQGETITSPVSGTVYSLKATKGSIQNGEELLSIVPDNEELLLEVKVLNRDIGFVNQALAKQQEVRAKVKLATFPFQEFGTIEGIVVKVSPNSIMDKDLGLVFPTRIRLKKTSVLVRNQEVKFTPGMAATAEIVTRKKSVLTFLIEPVTRRFSEAFSVR
jgi:HlyD family secretion protein